MEESLRSPLLSSKVCIVRSHSSSNTPDQLSTLDASDSYANAGDDAIAAIVTTRIIIIIITMSVSKMRQFHLNLLSDSRKAHSPQQMHLLIIITITMEGSRINSAGIDSSSTQQGITYSASY